MSKQQVHEIKRGMLVVRITFGRSKGQIRHRLDLFRLFKNGDQWKRSRRFCRDDIPVLRILLNDAYGWIFLEQEKSNMKTEEEKKVGDYLEHS